MLCFEMTTPNYRIQTRIEILLKRELNLMKNKHTPRNTHSRLVHNIETRELTQRFCRNTPARWHDNPYEVAGIIGQNSGNPVAQFSNNNTYVPPNGAHVAIEYKSVL